MAVAFDAAASTAIQSTIDFSWTHTPVGTPKGIIVYVLDVVGSDTVASITYGGVSMTEVALSPLIKAATEVSNVACFFLGSSIPTGAQTVAVTGAGTVWAKIGVSISVTGSADTEVIDTSTIQSDSVVNPSTTLSLGGREAFCAIGFVSGQTAPSGITPLTNWTSITEVDQGPQQEAAYRYDIIGTTDVTAGWTQTADDANAIAIAIGEVEAGGYELELSPGSFAITGQDTTLTKGWALSCDAGSFAITGQDVSLLRKYILTADAGGLTITGNDVSLLHGYLLSLEAGSFSLTGQDVSLLKSYLLTAEAGSLVITGQDVELIKSWLLEILPGTYTITGQDVTLTLAEAFVKKLAVASVTSRRGSASVSTNRASASAGVNQGSAIAYDAVASSGAVSTTQDFSWVHTPVGAPRGIIVYVLDGAHTGEVVGITYGGVVMTEVPLSPLAKTATEASRVSCFFLGSSIPTGAQTVAVTGAGTVWAKIGVSISVTASTYTEVINTSTIQSNSIASPSTTLSLGGRSAFCAIGFVSGHPQIQALNPLSNWTSIREQQIGQQVMAAYMYDIIDTDDVTAGWVSTFPELQADDANAIAIAIGEVVKHCAVASVTTRQGSASVSDNQTTATQ